MNNDTIGFSYLGEIIKDFPNICGGIIFGKGLNNTQVNEEIKMLFLQEQQEVLARTGKTPLSEIDSLIAWRGAFRQFNVNPTKYRSAAEALLRRLTKKGDIPSINTLVDIGNLVSIRYALPVAIFDIREVVFPVTVQFSDGTERFRPLFEDQIQHPEVGEVIFSDGSNKVIARRWCWRQSDESAANSNTTQVIIVIESQAAGGEVQIRQALDDLQFYLMKYVGGEYVVEILSSEKPSFSF